MRIHWRWQDASRATINNTDSAGRKKQTMSGNSVFCTQYAFAQVFIILLRRCANECQNTREQSELVWRDTFEKWTQRRQRRNSQNAAKQNETNKRIKENRKSFSLSTRWLRCDFFLSPHCFVIRSHECAKMKWDIRYLIWRKSVDTCWRRVRFYGEFISLTWHAKWSRCETTIGLRDPRAR